MEKKMKKKMKKMKKMSKKILPSPSPCSPTSTSPSRPAWRSSPVRARPRRSSGGARGARPVGCGLLLPLLRRRATKRRARHLRPRAGPALSLPVRRPSSPWRAWRRAWRTCARGPRRRRRWRGCPRLLLRSRRRKPLLLRRRRRRLRCRSRRRRRPRAAARRGAS